MSNNRFDQKFNAQSYNTLIDFAQFLRQNGDKLFEKDSKLCLRTDQLLILQDYLEQIVPNKQSDDSRPKQNVFNTKEFLTLYKSNQLHIIQDFLLKITNLKITAESPLFKNLIKLKIFGSLTYLEIKNCPINSISDLQNLRNQLEVLICVKSLTKIQDLLHLCGADQSMPLNWYKLHTLNLSYNQLNSLDSSFLLATSIEILDLSHNNIKDCGNYIHSLKKLKKINLSFNKLESMPSLSSGNENLIEYLDVSYNNIEKLEKERIEGLVNLVYLNLNSNLISELNQVKHLMLLKSVNYISLEQNPVKNDLYCDLIINEIKLHRTTKTRSQTVSVKTPLKQSIIHSIPNDLTREQLKSTRKPNYKSKLKANNILIEQDEKSEDDYLIINTNLETTRMSLTNKFPMSYESNNLQIEIENMKLMRQNYGTDWLLSTPNLITNKPTVEVVIDANEPKTVSTQVYFQPNEELANTIDPFVVYKYEVDEETTDLNQIEIKTCVLLSLNEKYLIEKDESNTNLLNVNEFSELADIKLVENDNVQIRFIFKDIKVVRAYKFENSDELIIFIQHLRKTLFNQLNLIKCELYYCCWCLSFNKKSKLSIDEGHETNDLTCTVCTRYLIKDKIILEKIVSSEVKETNLTLKDVLKTFKTADTSIDVSNEAEETLSNSSMHNTTATTTSILSEEEINNLGEKINNLLSNNKVTKAKLDETCNECKRINNNLKLYLIINVLNQENDDNDDEDEPVCYFKLKYFFYDLKTKQEVTNEVKCIENCLCVFTKRFIILFKVVNLELFNENSEFDKCLKKEIIIKINRIETIEVSLGYNYLNIETNDDDPSYSLKFLTMDIYQTSTFRNILLKIMNESKHAMMLKNSRKNNQISKENLSKLLSQIEIPVNESSNELDINIFTFVDELEIDNEIINITGCKYGIHELFLYSNEFIILLEENLNYFQEKTNASQFNLVEVGKINDIVQLRLFKEEETKLEISFVDESKNSKQYTWLLNFRKQPHMLSQLIALLKQTWEKTFFIELPINY